MFPARDLVVAQCCGNYDKPAAERQRINDVIIDEVVLPGIYFVDAPKAFDPDGCAAVKRSKQTNGAIEARRRKAEEWRRIQAQRAAERQRLRDYKIALARYEVAVDTTRLAPSNSYSTPDFVLRGTYRPEPFICKDCGVAEVWTPLQQKWWYETAKGDVFTAAVRCRACRTRERVRKSAARRVHLEGLARKKPPVS
ncbi:zinc-ribbon domain containing protein [Bradyrhizobium sp. BRP56]|uniref:zinc-ribbon domain containing protein n=1 Tax=Bradyrhizobium sp. BRP56 TaxID=2793819 RepID=UPI001CD68BF1|nr:zinc-ribbon domain containing protein [Bradyrhizobium sp. BRP56]